MKLAIYDFDGTYIQKQTIPILYHLWIKKGLNHRIGRKLWRNILWHYLLYKMKIFGWSKRRFNPYAMRLTADLLGSVDQPTLNQFIEDLYETLQKNVFQTLKDQLKQDQIDGYTTVLLSGNLDIILKPFTRDGFDYIIGSPAMKHGQLLNSKEVSILIEDKKKDIIIERFPHADLANSKAYADNGYDLPVLKMVGCPVAVHPDKELYHYAIQHEWKIIE